jgi:riboflavin synthase
MSVVAVLLGVASGIKRLELYINQTKIMFSGIVEATGRVVAVREDQGNKHITIEAPFTNELRIDQSIAHNGVCLTVVELDAPRYTVTAIHETLVKSNLGELQPGDLVNLERSMRPDALLDGHIVQGHVDQTARCTAISEADGSWYYTFEYDPTPGNITVEKGSVAVNGVSLTVVNSQASSFQVAIIPYTYEHTNFHTLKVGSTVNLEFDIVGKYITKLMKQYQPKA